MIQASVGNGDGEKHPGIGEQVLPDLGSTFSAKWWCFLWGVFYAHKQTFGGIFSRKTLFVGVSSKMPRAVLLIEYQFRCEICEKWVYSPQQRWECLDRVGNGIPYAAVYRGYSRYTVSYGIISCGCGLILSYRG